MAPSIELVASAETLAGVYETLLAQLPPTPAANTVLDGLFDSIAGIDMLVDGQVGQRARTVLGRLDENW